MIRTWGPGYALTVLMIAGCATTPTKETLGTRPERTIVILGEHHDESLAKRYAQRYSAIVLYTPSRGPIADVVSSSLRATLGPSSAMKWLMQELKSMNGTGGSWTLIIPRVAERYFAVTLRNMADGALAQAYGTVRLVDSVNDAAVEQEVQRVSNGSFTVQYGS